MGGLCLEKRLHDRLVLIRLRQCNMRTPITLIQNKRPNVYTQLGCSSGTGGGYNGDMTVCQAV